MKRARFEWDEAKNRENHVKHGVEFEVAQRAFSDPRRIIAEDVSHGGVEQRFYCFGRVGGGIVTVRFHHARRGHSDHRRWLLAAREEDL